MGKGNLEGRGTFDFRLLAQASVQRAEPRLQSSYNAFLTALFKMVDDSTCDDVICWAEDQRAFHIWRPNILVETIIPKFFGVKASFHTWRQRLDELDFERIVNDGRSTAQGRSTLVSNNWTFTHTFFCRALINKLKSAEEFKMAVWPMDAWQESVRDDYAWMASMNSGKPLMLSTTEAEEHRGRKPVLFAETKHPVY